MPTVPKFKILSFGSVKDEEAPAPFKNTETRQRSEEVREQLSRVPKGQTLFFRAEGEDKETREKYRRSIQRHLRTNGMKVKVLLTGDDKKGYTYYVRRYQ